MSLHNQKVGFMGQDIARKYLEEQGYSIVAENYRCRMGEIDLIATRKSVLVFLEVKTDLTGFFGEAEFRVDIRKQRRIKRAALFFLSDNQFFFHRNWEYRFDVIVVEKEDMLNQNKNCNPWDDSSWDDSKWDNSSQNNSSQNNSSQNNSSQNNSNKNNSNKNNTSKDNSNQDNSTKDNSSKNYSSRNYTSKDNSSKNYSSKDKSNKDNSNKERKINQQDLNLRHIENAF